MSAIVRINTGTKADPVYLYCAGYRNSPGIDGPSGPILVPDKKDAWQLQSREHAMNVIQGDVRLKGAETVEGESA